MKKALSTLLRSKESVVLAIIIVFVLILSFGSDTFINKTNFESLQTSIAPSAIIAVGMMILLISGVFDLSVGSIMGLSGVVVSFLLMYGLPVPLAIAGGLGVGVAFGLFNGFLVAFVGVNPLIATIGTLYIGRGLVNALLRGERSYGVPFSQQSFIILGTGKTFGLYNMFWIMLLIVIIAQFVTQRTYIGRQLYYIGGNKESARLVGIKVRKIRVITYALSGFLASLAGLLATARFEVSSKHLGSNLELQIIIACLIGGASIAGGQGSIIGGLLGVMFMSLIVNLFNIMEISSFWQNLVVGFILIFVVFLDSFLNMRRQRKLL
jgi:ribose/xylose/arabinose/galactoside ABC-type transport system permease subunit